MVGGLVFFTAIIFMSYMVVNFFFNFLLKNYYWWALPEEMRSWFFIAKKTCHGYFSTSGKIENYRDRRETFRDVLMLMIALLNTATRQCLLCESGYYLLSLIKKILYPSCIDLSIEVKQSRYKLLFESAAIPFGIVGKIRIVREKIMANGGIVDSVPLYQFIGMETLRERNYQLSSVWERDTAMVRSVDFIVYFSLRIHRL